MEQGREEQPVGRSLERKIVFLFVSQHLREDCRLPTYAPHASLFCVRIASVDLFDTEFKKSLLAFKNNVANPLEIT
jgi:hypothetical protein